MTTDCDLPYPGYRERPQAYWEFCDTLARAQEVTDLLTDVRERVAAGEPMPQELALALLDEAIAARAPHMQGTAERVWAPGDTYEVCVGCGKQVMSVWRGNDVQPMHEPGVCADLKDVDFAVRTAMRLPTPNGKEHRAALGSNQ